jgi:hypothetical protein
MFLDGGIVRGYGIVMGYIYIWVNYNMSLT